MKFCIIILGIDSVYCSTVHDVLIHNQESKPSSQILHYIHVVIIFSDVWGPGRPDDRQVLPLSASQWGPQHKDRHAAEGHLPTTVLPAAGKPQRSPRVGERYRNKAVYLQSKSTITPVDFSLKDLNKKLWTVYKLDTYCTSITRSSVF